MESRKLDCLIQETLEEHTSEVSMSSELQQQIKQEIRRKSEEKFMARRISKRKVVFMAAVLCLIGSMAAIAAGKVTGWTSHTNPTKPDFVSLKDIGRAEAKMGSSIQAVEKFSNGYEFTKGFITEIEESDSSGQTVGLFPSIRLGYEKGNSRLNISLYPADKATGSEKHKEIIKIPYQDYTMTFTKDIYKFVPPEYEITPEERTLMDAGELYISYGSSAVEVEEIISLSWTMGDIHYLLMPSGQTNLTQDNLVQMAKEIIDNK